MQQSVKILIIFSITILLFSSISHSIIGIETNDFEIDQNQTQIGSCDEIDQQQTQIGTYDKIYNQTHVAQSFVPTLPILTRIEIYLSKNGSITSDITLIVKDSRNGPSLSQVSVSSDKIKLNEGEWIEFDFPDLGVNRDITYYIYCRTDLGDEDNCYQWYGSIFDGYEEGLKYISNNSGTTWEQYSEDCTFKTYGAGPSPEIIFVVGGVGPKIDIGVKNSGNSEAKIIKITAEFSGGIIVRDFYTERLDTTLEPDYELSVPISPIVGLGHSYVKVSVWWELFDKIKSVEVTEYVWLLLFYTYVIP
jgi:hypothetical protein